MTSQGLYKISSLDAKEAREQVQVVSCVWCDVHPSFTGIDQSTCLIPTYFKFGSKCSDDSSNFTPIPSTISACAAIDGFDVVFSQASSGLLHCLPLGDYDGTQELIPVLSFARMQGDIAQLACVPQAEILAAADTNGAMALFSTSDAARLDYKPDCSRRPITALFACQGLLVSGDDGGEICIWNIAEASLVPVITVSAPGRVTAAIITQATQPGNTIHGSHQIVAGTHQGDVFVWEVDLGNVSEPWEPYNAQVLKVGMLSLSNTAVTLMQAIPSDNSMSRLCCLDLTDIKAPVIVSNDNPPHVCHMRATSAPSTSVSQAPTQTCANEQESRHLLLQLWTKGRESGMSLHQHPVPAVQWHQHPPSHCKDGAAGRPDRPYHIESDRTAADPRITADRSTVHSIPGPTPAQNASAAAQVHDNFHVSSTSEDPRVPKTSASVDHCSAETSLLQNAAASNDMHAWDVHEDEDDAPGEFSLRALQPAKIVTVPPASHQSSLSSAPHPSGGGDKNTSEGGMDPGVRFSKDSLDQENSFCLKSEARTSHTEGGGTSQTEGGGTKYNANFGVSESSELESMQLAELLGVDTTSGDNEQRAEVDVPSRQPVKAERMDAYSSLAAESLLDSNHHLKTAVAHTQVIADQGAPAVQPSTAVKSAVSVLQPESGNEAVVDALVSNPHIYSACEPRNRADMSLDELRAVREQLEAMFLDQDDEYEVEEGVQGDASHDADVPKAQGPRTSVTDASVSNLEKETLHLDTQPDQGQSSSLAGEKDLPSGSSTTEQGYGFEHVPTQQPSHGPVSDTKSALQSQFESLGILQHHDSSSIPERSSSPQQYHNVSAMPEQPSALSSADADRLVHHLDDDLHAPPDSPDSLRSSSVFVPGSLQPPPHPDATHSSYSNDKGTDQGSVDLTRQHRSVPSNRSSTAPFNPRNSKSGSHRHSQSSESRAGHSATLNQWLSDSQSRESGEPSRIHSPSHKGDAAFQQPRAAPHHTTGTVDTSAHSQLQHASTDAMWSSPQASFSLSELAAAQHQQIRPTNATQPIDQRQSGGGIAWALEVGNDRPFARKSPENSASHCSSSSRICGRQTGQVSASKMQDTRHTAGRAQQNTSCSDTTLQPIPRKPSTAALLRRLTRKKPTVRQILGKAPPPSNSLHQWHQENRHDLSASMSTLAHLRSQEALNSTRSPAPKTPASNHRASSRAATRRTPPPAVQTPPSCGASRIPALSKAPTPLHNSHGLHAFDAAPLSASGPPGVILVPANPKLLHCSKTSPGSGAAARKSSAPNNRTPNSSSRRSKARSPSPYHINSRNTPTRMESSVALHQSIGRKAPRRVPLQDRLNTQGAALCQVSDVQDAPVDNPGPHQHHGEAAADTENRHPSLSSSRGASQPHRKRSRSAHFRGGSSRSITVTAVPASAPASNTTPAAPQQQHREPRQQADTHNQAPGAAAQWPAKQHGLHGMVVSEGALLQESSVSDRPPVSVSRWKVERAAGELAARQHEFISLRTSSDQFRQHGTASGDAVHLPNPAPAPSGSRPSGAINSQRASQGHEGLLGLLAQENNGLHSHKGDPGESHEHAIFETSSIHHHPEDQSAENQHEEHPLARSRPGAMTQLLSSRIASTAAEAPPQVPENSAALASGRRAAATIASNVPRKSTLYVAVPAVPPALAEARAAAAAAINNGDTVNGSSVAAGALSGAAAASAALDALRKQSARRSGKGLRASHANLARSVIPPPLMEDLWKREDHVVQEAPYRPLPPPEPRSVAQVMAEVLQLHQYC